MPRLHRRAGRHRVHLVEVRPHLGRALAHPRAVLAAEALRGLRNLHADRLLVDQRQLPLAHHHAAADDRGPHRLLVGAEGDLLDRIVERDEAPVVAVEENDVGLLADLDRADLVLHQARPRRAVRRHVHHLVRRHPLAVVVGADLVDQARRLEGREHVGGVGRGDAVAAERDVGAGVLEFPDRRHARAEFQVGERVVGDRPADPAEQLDVALGQPDRVVHGQPVGHAADIGEELRQRLVVFPLPGDGLRLGLEHVAVDRQVEVGGEPRHFLEQRRRAALRPARPEDDPHPVLVVPGGAEVLEQLDLVAVAGDGEGVEPRLELRRHEVADEGQAVHERLVPHRRRDPALEAEVAIGARRGVDRVGGEGEVDDVVLERGDAGADRDDADQHGAEVPVAPREVGGAERRVDLRQPDLQRQVVVAPHLEAFVRVHVGVDEAGEDQPVLRLDDLDPGMRCGLRAEVGADRRDPVADDQHVAALQHRALRVVGDDVSLSDQEGQVRSFHQ